MTIARRRPLPVRPANVALAVLLIVAAAFFLLPLYVMVVTSLKPIQEIRSGQLFALPVHPTMQAWSRAWSEACTGLHCEGIRVGFWNSVAIVVPATIGSVFLGAVNGYALTFWKPRGGNALFTLLLLGALVPYQAVMFPLVRGLANAGLFGTLAGIVIVHVGFGMPLTTLLFRSRFAAVPNDLFLSARIDGVGFWRIFWQLMLPLSVPTILVATILQATNIWNDFILGLVFAGHDNLPMTVQLNNILATSTGERLYNVDMAATLLTSLLPLAVYLSCGRWVMRGIATGAVKG